MAARLNTNIQDKVRAQIKTTQLTNFLHAVATTGKDTGGHPIENMVRVQAAKILLDKTLSNAPTELHGEIDGEIAIRWLGKS